jgi:uncharacterized protein
MSALLYILIGLAGGILSGAFGVGGGVIMVPALVFLCGLTQHQAQGTTLAVLLPPVFILAVWRYYIAGHINIPMAAYIALGFVFGTLLGADFVQKVSDIKLQTAFGILLILVGIKMVFLK